MTSLATKIILAALAAVLLAAATFAAVSSADDSGSSERLSAQEANKPIYDRQWKRKVQPQRKRWARRLAECESGRNPNALGAGGTYRGAFQFSRSTWANAPRSPGGDPIRFSFKTQAFIAVRLRMRDGKGHWPNCP